MMVSGFAGFRVYGMRVPLGFGALLTGSRRAHSRASSRGLM